LWCAIFHRKGRKARKGFVQHQTFLQPLFGVKKYNCADNLVSAAQGEDDESYCCVYQRCPAIFIDGSADIPQIPKDE